MFAAVVADSRPLREVHPELRVAIVKMEDARRDLYEAADAVLEGSENAARRRLDQDIFAAL
jgi:hypothetical protein